MTERGVSTPPPTQRAGVISVVRDTEEGVHFLRTRLELYYLALLPLTAGFLVLANLIGMFVLHRPLGFMLRHPGNHTHLVHVGLFAGGWAICHFTRPSRRALELVDALGILAICSCHALIVYLAPAGAHPALDLFDPASPNSSALNANIVALAGRAILVPSSPWRSLNLSSAAALPMLFVAHLLYHQYPGAPAISFVVAVYLWSLLAVGLGTISSSVIYSLHERVREAQQLGQYTLERQIGRGGMGVVYRARHGMLRRPTAIKLLPSEQAGDKNLERFEREVQMTSRLTHPNTISIYDYGRTPGGIFYYAMELLDGADLDRLVQITGPLPPARAVHVLSQVCAALTEAHGLGLIHRDIKPSNVFLCRQGGLHDVAKVLDFGLVRAVDAPADLHASSSAPIVGTPLYLSPEAITTPDRVDARTDIYALGCLAHFLLTGRPPFMGQTVIEVCSQHLHIPAPRVSQHAHGPIPPALESIVARCLAKDTGARPADTRMLGQQLAACGVAPWTDAEAVVWWAAKGRQLREPVQPPPGAPTASFSAGQTIVVDARTRAAEM